MLSNFIKTQMQCDVACKVGQCTAPNDAKACKACDTDKSYLALPDKANECYLTTGAAPSGYYKTATNTWGKCDVACNECTGADNKTCKACDTTKSYLALPDKATECYLTTGAAPSGYYKTATNTWGKCDNACNECTGADNKTCKACNTAANFFPLADKATECYDKAPAGTYFNATLKNWGKCDVACNECTGADNKTCKACDTTKSYLALPDKATECYLTTGAAPAGYYKTATNTWGKCDVACNGCTDATNLKCTACDTTKSYLALPDKATECYLTTGAAPAGYYKTATNTWGKCNEACNGCTGADNKTCVACNIASKFYPLSDKATECYEKAPAGYAFLNEDSKWDKCDVACNGCTDATNLKCTACNTDKGYLALPDKATECYLTTGAAPAGYYKTATNTWGKCNEACNGCTGADNKTCTACNNTSKFYALNVGTASECLKEAPGNYLNAEKKVWEKCDVACTGCTGAGNTNCNVCNTIANYTNLPDKKTECYLISDTAIAPKGYFRTKDNKSWGKCDNACDGCSEATNLDCIKCDNAKLYFTISNSKPKEGKTTCFLITDKIEGYVFNEKTKLFDKTSGSGLVIGIAVALLFIIIIVIFLMKRSSAKSDQGASLRQLNDVSA